METADLSKLLSYVDLVWLLPPLLYGVFIVSRIIPMDSLGLVPRRFSRLHGILTMALLHDDLKHLLANTVPLIVLLALMILAGHPHALATSVLIQLCGGAALWLVGRRANHIGASLLVFGLTGFHMAAGYFQSNITTIVFALLVVVLYGGTFLSSIVPWKQGSSWDGHLCGFLGGVAVAYAQALGLYESLPL
jgi:membrane associated rhomboid family serine protease